MSNVLLQPLHDLNLWVLINKTGFQILKQITVGAAKEAARTFFRVIANSIFTLSVLLALALLVWFEKGVTLSN